MGRKGGIISLEVHKTTAGFQTVIIIYDFQMCMKSCKLPSDSISKMHVHNSGIIVVDYTTNAVMVTTTSA
jgi:hypothetical protein